MTLTDEQLPTQDLPTIASGAVGRSLAVDRLTVGKRIRTCRPTLRPSFGCPGVAWVQRKGTGKSCP